jgi:hypothetical protein
LHRLSAGIAKEPLELRADLTSDCLLAEHKTSDSDRYHH